MPQSGHDNEIPTHDLFLVADIHLHTRYSPEIEKGALNPPHHRIVQNIIDGKKDILDLVADESQTTRDHVTTESAATRDEIRSQHRQTQIVIRNHLDATAERAASEADKKTVCDSLRFPHLNSRRNMISDRCE